MAAERMDGVTDAEFAYPEGTGTITFDTTVTSAEAIVAELKRATGFDATARVLPSDP